VTLRWMTLGKTRGSRAGVRAQLSGVGVLLALIGVSWTSCSSGPKRTTPELSKLEGKKVALVEVEAEPTARRIVEVALVNQLVKDGTFILVSKQDVDAARTQPKTDLLNPIDIARAAGADFALLARVLEFDATTREGYSKEVVEDSQLAEERGEKERMTERLYKVKSLTGKVRVEMTFLPAAADADLSDRRTAVAEADQVVTAEAKTSAARLPPKMRFLEELTNQAFAKFFETYRD
jgi:hypothetical protein